MKTLRPPLDNNGRELPVLAALAGDAHQGAAGVASSRIGPLAEGAVIEIFATAAARYQSGGSTVTADATSHYIAAGERLQRFLPAGHTHLAVIRAGDEDAAIEVTELS